VNEEEDIGGLKQENPAAVVNKQSPGKNEK
jgi:hypothetical protein